MQVVGGQELTCLDVHLALSAPHITQVCQVEKRALWKVTHAPVLQEEAEEETRLLRGK